ncbi:hypothetical protein MB46_14510 [Arthrobacter alpinus]|uniref:NAD-dependent epimerase/dehydratase family protein n=1 Tax=Arthrobacter alpinus TaxID=656366 RepID=UPI0005CB1F6D|nr:NAD-dependent epimerase/dehydratase family protein [Arthrobacter alpinus]ALV46524.1 hypothetical protein MB46_14510 [Arthrobacter alpinus]
MANILILGGTAWLGRTLAQAATSAGHAVTCLARGDSGDFPVAASGVVGDRDSPDAYAAVAGREWDLVVELTRIPSHAHGALAAVSERARNWVFVSSCSVYAGHSTPEADEDTPRLDPLGRDERYTPEVYGEAKSACEIATLAARDSAALLIRAGLIGGPGDPTGRTTYWPLRAADVRGPVLTPSDDGPHYPQHVQIIDVRDLASFILNAGLAGRTGAVNAVGAALPLCEALNTAREAANTNPQLAEYPLARMVDDGVSPWSGPRSLPLVLPLDPDYAGFARRSDARALAWGLVRRPLLETFRDIIASEEPWTGRQLGAGLNAGDEAELLAGS